MKTGNIDEYSRQILDNLWKRFQFYTKNSFDYHLSASIIGSIDRPIIWEVNPLKQCIKWYPLSFDRVFILQTYLSKIVRSDALVPCLTEVKLASGKEKATKVVRKVSLGVTNPLPNEEGITPNDRFCFAETGPNVELEEVVTLNKERNGSWGRGAIDSSCPGH